MARINIDIPDDVHARLKMIASAEGKGFYEHTSADVVRQTQRTVSWRTKRQGICHNGNLANVLWPQLTDLGPCQTGFE